MGPKSDRCVLSIVVCLAFAQGALPAFAGPAPTSTSEPPSTTVAPVPSAFAIQNLDVSTIDGRDPLEIAAGQRGDQVCIVVIFAASPGPGTEVDSFLYDLNTEGVTGPYEVAMPSTSTFGLGHHLFQNNSGLWITTVSSGYNPQALRSDDCENWEVFPYGTGNNWGSTEIAPAPGGGLLGGAFNYGAGFYSVQTSTDGETWNAFGTVSGPNARPVVGAINQGVRPCITEDFFYGGELAASGPSFNHFVRPLTSSTPVLFYDTDVFGPTLAESVCSPGGWVYAHRSPGQVRFRAPTTDSGGDAVVGNAPTLTTGQFFGICQAGLGDGLQFVAYPQDHIAVIDTTDLLDPHVIQVPGNLPGQQGPAYCSTLELPVLPTTTPAPSETVTPDDDLVRAILYLSAGGSLTLTRFDLVAGAGPTVPEIPTISGWGLAIMIALLALVQFLVWRGRSRDQTST